MKPTNRKPGMMIYFTQWYVPLKLLDGESVKELLCDVLNLAENGEYPERFSDMKVEAFFHAMSEAILRDDEQYQKKIEQRKRAGQASVSARQRSLTDVSDRQRMSTNTIQPNPIQLQSNNNSIQSNSEQYSSTQPNKKYWGDNKLWEERCEHYGVDPYSSEQKAYYDKAWKITESEDENIPVF